MTQKTKNSALQVANTILQRSFNEKHPISHLKLQKLLYILHGWHLSIQKGAPAFYEPVEAWSLGPVVARVYHHFKHWDDRPIGEENMEKTDLPISREEDSGLHKILDMVWENYKDRTSFTLVDLTHARGAPWDIVYIKNRYVRHAVIDNELIRTYYDDLIKSFRERKNEEEDYG